MFKKFNNLFKNIDALLAVMERLENKVWYQQKRIQWLMDKFNLKCPHENLDFDEEKQLHTCMDCGREWSSHNFLSE